MPDKLTHVEAETARLRAKGFTDAQIERILIEQEVAASQRQQAAAGAVGQSNMTGALGNAAAVASHARGTIPLIKGELANVFSRRASTSSRAKSAGLVALAVVVVAALGFGVYLELKQLYYGAELARNNEEITHVQLDPIPDFHDMDMLLGAAGRADAAGRAAVKDAFKAGDYAGAYKLVKQHEAAVEAEGEITAPELLSVSWYALFARKFTEALDAAERSISLKPGDLMAATNQAHALMFLGRADEAKAIYLRHKGEKLADKTWEQVIADDFAELRKAGLANPLMDEISTAFASP